MSDATPGPISTARGDIDPSAEEVVVDVGKLGDLFQAPDADPFSARAVDALGVAGIEYVGKRLRKRWPQQAKTRRLRVRLPAGQLPADPAARQELERATQAAVHRYCEARVRDSEQARKLAVRAARTEMLIAAVVTVTALYLLGLEVSGVWSFAYPFLQGVLIVFSLLAASLAIWDALESRFFDPVPYRIDVHVFTALSTLDVILAPDAGA